MCSGFWIVRRSVPGPTRRVIGGRPPPGSWRIPPFCRRGRATLTLAQAVLPSPLLGARIGLRRPAPGGLCRRRETLPEPRVLRGRARDSLRDVWGARPEPCSTLFELSRKSLWIRRRHLAVLTPVIAATLPSICVALLGTSEPPRDRQSLEEAARWETSLPAVGENEDGHDQAHCAAERSSIPRGPPPGPAPTTALPGTRRLLRHPWQD